MLHVNSRNSLISSSWKEFAPVSQGSKHMKDRSFMNNILEPRELVHFLWRVKKRNLLLHAF